MVLKMSDQPKKKERGYSLQVTKPYKLKLDKASRTLSDEAEERVTITKVVYTLIENYLDQAMDDIRKEF
jgi:hypothetical protein